MRRRSVFIACMLCAALAGTAEGQERDQKDEAPSVKNKAADADEEEDGAQHESAIIVTARRLDAARSRVDQGLGATVYSLDNETIESRPGGETGSISSILSQAPGTTLSGSALTVRGSRGIQVRINDIILPEVISDPADHLSSRLAETTRLITGTLPAQFGFAPGGVISVTTKNGLYQRGGQAEFFAGSSGMIEPAVEWAGSAAGTSLFASGSLERSRARIEDAFGNAAHDRTSESEGLLFADHLLGANNRISLIVGGSNEYYAIGATSLPSGRGQSSDAYGVAIIQHNSGPLSLQAALSRAGAVDEARFIFEDSQRRSSTGAQLDAEYSLGDNRIGLGLLLTKRRVDGVAREKRSRSSLGLYAQDEWTILSGLTVNGGIRADWLRSESGSAELEPRASLVWQSSGGFSAHVGYSRFASPAPLEEERGPRSPIERDDYFDAGIQQKIGAWTVGIDGYWRAVRDLIAERQMPGAATPASFSFERARLRGLELSAIYARGAITGWANLALSQSRARRIVAGETLFSPAELSAAADHWVPLASGRAVTASGGFTWRIGKFSFGANLLAGSGAVKTLVAADPNGGRAAPFAVAGLSAKYHARIANKPADIRIDLTNLTNAHYLTSDAANLEGGWTRFGDRRAILIGIEQGF
ncbi:MAG: TonB-dependent receptor [Sphingomicrobium sp.]